MTRPILLLSILYLLLVGLSNAHADDAACVDSGDTHLWLSPLNPKPNTPLKLLAVATDAALSELSVVDAQGQRFAVQATPRGGPPWHLSAAVDGIAAGRYQIEAWRNGQRVGCKTVDIGGANARAEAQTWGLATEAFYSAWIELLFDAPPATNLSFPSLEPVLRDPGRNFLHNHLGLNEDLNLPATPDCADLPYTLRAYFAWKIGLPVSFRACGRGSATTPPQCSTPSIKTEFLRGASSTASYRAIANQLANAVHSGSARTALNAEASDLYPTALLRETLWPGTVYADPYGHVLILAQWVAQSENRPGLLLAVDAQPDNSVTRKRVWEGTFLYANTPGAGPGFKAFRPLVQNNNGAWRLLSNDDLVENPSFQPFSLEQSQLAPEDFYARLDKLINPNGLKPKQAYEATLDALVEQVETRVTSVENGEAYFRKNPGSVIPMPTGASIFETIGPWEDYSTPSRDMRLVIAINVLNGLPDKLIHHPELFILDGASPQAVKTEIEQYHARRIQDRRIRYIRSDGTPWDLTIAEILARKSAYEMGYNPNECAEARWGASPGSTEYAPCRRHAPAAQTAKMQQYRAWFRDAKRPTR